MNKNHVEAISKFIEAKQLEKEALMLLMPQKTRNHLEVISKEVKAMILENLLDEEEKEGSSHKSSVNKVSIE